MGSSLALSKCASMVLNLIIAFLVTRNCDAAEKLDLTYLIICLTCLWTNVYWNSSIFCVDYKSKRYFKIELLMCVTTLLLNLSGTICYNVLVARTEKSTLFDRSYGEKFVATILGYVLVLLHCSVIRGVYNG